MSDEREMRPLYLSSGNPALEHYHPAWLDKLAEDATVEGSMLDGIVQGKEAVRAVVTTIRSMYDYQAHKYAGPCGEAGFLEDYVAEVAGHPIGCVVLVTFNEDGEAQHIVASYRPRSSLMYFSRRLAEKFNNSEIGAHFRDAQAVVADAPERGRGQSAHRNREVNSDS